MNRKDRSVKPSFVKKAFEENEKKAILQMLSTPKSRNDLQAYLGIKDPCLFFNWLITCANNDIPIYEGKCKNKTIYGVLQGR